MPQNMLFAHNILFCTQKMQRHLKHMQKKILTTVPSSYLTSVGNMMTSLSYGANREKFKITKYVEKGQNNTFLSFT